MNILLRLLLCIYAFEKYLFGWTKDHTFQQYSESKGFLLRLFFITCTLVTCLLLSILCLPFVVCHLLIDFYLRIRVGRKYGGLLRGQDVTMASVGRSVYIRIVMILNEEQHNPIDWKACLDIAKDFHNASWKFSSEIKNCLGYRYFVRNQIKFEDVVDEVRIGDSETITKDDFINFANKIHQRNDEKRLWSLTYLPQPIKWKKGVDNTKQYALVVSVNHALADGPNLMKICMLYLMTSPYNPPKSNLIPNLKNLPKFSIDDAYIYRSPIYSSDKRYPQLNNLEEQYFTALFSEDTEKYLQLIKKVKTKLGVGFNSVLLSAFSSSLNDHLKKYKRKPIDITLWGIIRPEEINLVFKCSDEDQLMNDIGNQIIKVPAMLSTLTTAERIRHVHDTLKEVRGSLDATMMYSLPKIAQFLPAFGHRIALDASTGNVASIISNMSGMENLAYCGHNITSSMFYISNVPAPFMFCVMSLDGKMQMSLNASGCYVKSREELDDIIDGTLSYLDKFGEEILIE